MCLRVSSEVLNDSVSTMTCVRNAYECESSQLQKNLVFCCPGKRLCGWRKTEILM